MNRNVGCSISLFLETCWLLILKARKCLATDFSCNFDVLDDLVSVMVMANLLVVT